MDAFLARILLTNIKSIDYKSWPFKNLEIRSRRGCM